MPFEWQVRKRAAIVVTFLLEKLHGEEAAKTWLWSMTPFPADVPRWGECVQGLIAALLPGKLHGKFMDAQLYAVDRQMMVAIRSIKTEGDAL